MRRIINILLFLIVLVLAFLLFKSIQAPVKYRNLIADRTEAVHNKLKEIRTAQIAVKDASDYFAPTFDSLVYLLKNQQFELTNPDTKETIEIPIIDSLYKGDTTRLDDLRYVPFTDKKEFEMGSGVVQSPSDSTIYIPVFEASTFTDAFLNDINKNFWEADKKVKVGSLTSPILKGNWE